MEIFIVWFALSIVAGVIAGNKKRSGFGFFLLSLLLSPLIGIIAALIAKPNTDKLEKQQLNEGKSKKCPFCAELIKKEAIVCRYCSRELPQPKVTENQDVPIAKEKENNNNQCSQCKHYHHHDVGFTCYKFNRRVKKSEFCDSWELAT